MLVPGIHLVCRHLHWWFGGAEAVETRSDVSLSFAFVTGSWTDFDISFVETNIPRHNSTIRPVNATETNSLVRVRKTRTAFHGGSRDLAAFQLTPPFGRIMVCEA